MWTEIVNEYALILVCNMDSNVNMNLTDYELKSGPNMNSR